MVRGHAQFCSDCGPLFVEYPVLLRLRSIIRSISVPFLFAVARASLKHHVLPIFAESTEKSGIHLSLTQGYVRGYSKRIAWSFCSWCGARKGLEPNRRGHARFANCATRVHLPMRGSASSGKKKRDVRREIHKLQHRWTLDTSTVIADMRYYGAF